MYSDSAELQLPNVHVGRLILTFVLMFQYRGRQDLTEKGLKITTVPS